MSQEFGLSATVENTGEMPAETGMQPQSAADLQNVLQEAFAAPQGHGEESDLSRFARAALSQADGLSAFCASSVKETTLLRGALVDLCRGMADIASKTEQDFTAVAGQMEVSKTAFSIVASDLKAGLDRLASAEINLRKIAEDSSRAHGRIDESNNLVARMEQWISMVGEKGEKTEQRAEALHSSIEGIQDAVVSINKKLNTLSDMGEHIAVLRKQNDQTTSMIRSLQAALTGLNDISENERSERQRLAERLSTVESNICTILEREENLSKWQRRVSQVMHSVSAQ